MNTNKAETSISIEKKSSSYLKRQTGFTLLEMMVVVMIIGLLASLIVPNLMGNKSRANQKKAVADITALESALDMYRLDHNNYPSNDEGLLALTQKDANNVGSGPYIKRLPQDPWQRNYQYNYPGTHGEVDIFTFGEDGQVGGEGSAADIGNWNVEQF